MICGAGNCWRIREVLGKELGLWSQTELDQKSSFVLPGSIASGTPVSVRIRTTKQKLLSVFKSIRVITHRLGCLCDCWKGWKSKGQGKPLVALRFPAGSQRLRKLLQLFSKGIAGHCHQWSQLLAPSGRVISRETSGG